MKKLSRRQVILGLGAAGTGAALTPLISEKPEVAAITPKPHPTCTVFSEQTEGPFYFETKFIRQDITEGHEGTILHLKLKLVDAESCQPLQDAVVDIWSCDARGVYSGYESVMTQGGKFKSQQGDRRDSEKHANDERPRFHQEPNNEKTFMRGAQVSDASGEVSFKTLYPGWYPGRATHIHIKVYLDNNEVFTSQMYFPDEINDEVHASGVYTEMEKEGRRLQNGDDGIFRRSNNSPMVELTEVEDGFVGTLTFGIKAS